MDAGTHLRAIWRHRVLVLVGAVLAATTVFAFRSAAAPTYASSALLFVVPGSADVPDVQSEIRRLGTRYADRSDDLGVLADAADRLPGVSPAALQRMVRVPAPDSSQVEVLATGRTATESAAAANAVAAALSATADREQATALAEDLAPLDAELEALEDELQDAESSGADTGQITSRQDSVYQARLERLSESPARLDLVSEARVADAERTPTPIRDAVLAFLLALILLSELVALLAARRAGVDGRDPVPLLREWTHLPVFRIGGSRRGPDRSAGVLLHAGSPGGEQDHPPVLALVPLSVPAEGLQRALRGILTTAVAVHGHAVLLDLRAHAPDQSSSWLPPRVEHVRPTGDQPDAALLALQRHVVPAPLPVLVADSWDDPALLLLSRALSAVTLLLVESRTVRRPAVQEAIAVLQDVRTPASAVVVVERVGRRKGRRSEEAPLHRPPPSIAARPRLSTRPDDRTGSAVVPDPATGQGRLAAGVEAEGVEAGGVEVEAVGTEPR